MYVQIHTLQVTSRPPHRTPHIETNPPSWEVVVQAVSTLEAAARGSLQFKASLVYEVCSRTARA